MIQKKEVYETIDGKIFKTKKGAENHQSELEAFKVIENLGLTKDEIQEKLVEISSRNHKVKIMLNDFKDWTKWSAHMIKHITPDLFREPDKKTLYIIMSNSFGRKIEDVLHTEKEPDFTDPELHTKDIYKVDKVEVVDEYTKKVFYVPKYSNEEIIEKKIKAGENLIEKEIAYALNHFEEVYCVEHEDRRWSRTVTSVIEVGGELYTINWEHGLTEYQDNSFPNQPFKVELETEEVVVTKTNIVKLEGDS